MKITGSYVDHASGKSQSHSVELTEKDLLLLDHMLCTYKPVNRFRIDRAKELHTQVKEMLEDY